MQVRQQRGRRPSAIGSFSASGRKHRPDYWVVILSLLLLAIGMIVVYSISPALAVAGKGSSGQFMFRQFVAVILSLIAFVVAARVPLAWWRKMAIPVLAVAAVATLIALVTPLNPSYPAHRWVRLGGFSFQSVELLKFALLIVVSGYLADKARDRQLSDFKQTLKPLLIGLVVIGIVVAGPGGLHGQSDLGSMGVIIAMMAVMAFVAGVPMKRLAMLAGVLAIGVILVVLPSGYRRARIETYMHPEQDCQTTGYQACQALIAVGSGGISGLGLGRSVQAYGYLPEASNDSIFAIYAEKFGFIGACLLLAIFIGFFGRIKKIAERSPDMFSQLVTVGVLTWLSVQAIVNIGAMLGLLPLKGITLPFISSGGTSVVFVAAAVGLVFQISHYTSLTERLNPDSNRGNNYDDSRDGRRLRGAYHPNLGGR